MNAVDLRRKLSATLRSNPKLQEFTIKLNGCGCEHHISSLSVDIQRRVIVIEGKK